MIGLNIRFLIIALNIRTVVRIWYQLFVEVLQLGIVYSNTIVINCIVRTQAMLISEVLSFFCSIIAGSSSNHAVVFQENSKACLCICGTVPPAPRRIWNDTRSISSHGHSMAGQWHDRSCVGRQ